MADLVKPTDGGESGYVLDKDLATAVNLAWMLGRPLLITGEPGTGKSDLAQEIVRQQPGWQCYDHQCKSTSEARDILYSYAAMRRWDDSHRNALKPADHYISYHALGRAIKERRECVVLIDDIDKAPRDFANDLLLEIDKRRFTVPELRGELDAQGKPLVHEFGAGAEDPPFMVVITSNSEQELAAPFLRRCVHHFVRFPGREMLLEILERRVGPRAPRLPGEGPAPKWNAAVAERAVVCFQALREQPLLKKPTTGELIAWVRGLLLLGVGPEALEPDAAGLRRLPLRQALLKTPADWRLLASDG
jgi:MoxR-like ATPase